MAQLFRTFNLIVFTLILLSSEAWAANRYWVGGTDTWNGTAGSKWSTTSCGSGGSAVPTASDDVYIEASCGGAKTVTVSGTRVCRSFTVTGSAGNIQTIGGTSTPVLNIGTSTAGTFSMGNFTVFGGGPPAINFISTTTGNTVTSPGIFVTAVTFNGVGGGWTLQNDLNAQSQTVTLTNGTLDTNGQTVNVSIFSSNNSNTRTLTLGASAITCSSISTAWNLATTTNLTFNANTSTITLSGPAATFAGGGLTYNIVQFTTTTTAPTISGSNTFTTLIWKKNLNLTQSTTQTVTNLYTNADPCNLGTLQSTTTTNASLALTNEYVDYITATDITVTGITLTCAGCTDGGGGNSGITFNAGTGCYKAASGLIGSD